jgi:hypothetical protein
MAGPGLGAADWEVCAALSRQQGHIIKPMKKTDMPPHKRNMEKGHGKGLTDPI